MPIVVPRQRRVWPSCSPPGLLPPLRVTIAAFSYVETIYVAACRTLILATYCLAFAFPLGILLRSGRRSTSPDQGFARRHRAYPRVPMIILAPPPDQGPRSAALVLPSGSTIDNSCAPGRCPVSPAPISLEIVRGLPAVAPKGHFEAADAWRLNYAQTDALIVLPQALRVVSLPPLCRNTFIGFFKGHLAWC